MTNPFSRRPSADPRLRSSLVALALVFGVLLGACGGGDTQPTTTSPPAGPSAGSSGGGNTGSGENGEAGLMGPPPVDETVDEAVDRIQDVLASDDCDTINELNPLGRPGLATEQRCEVLQRLEGLDVVGAEQYGKLGAVIAYQRGARVLNLLLVRDSDGLLHIAFIDPFAGRAGTKGTLARQFNEVAETGVRALAERDCDAFLDVAYGLLGPGRGSDQDVCERVNNNIVAALLERGGKAKPMNLEGGSSYAFLGIDTPVSYLTLVAARQSDEDLPSGTAVELPKDAPEYGIIDSLRTNPRQPIEAP